MLQAGLVFAGCRTGVTGKDSFMTYPQGMGGGQQYSGLTKKLGSLPTLGVLLNEQLPLLAITLSLDLPHTLHV